MLNVPRDTPDVVSSKWKLLILATLPERKFRFRELSRKLGITPRVLAKEPHPAGLANAPITGLG